MLLQAIDIKLSAQRSIECYIYLFQATIKCNMSQFNLLLIIGNHPSASLMYLFMFSEISSKYTKLNKSDVRIISQMERKKGMLFITIYLLYFIHVTVQTLDASTDLTKSSWGYTITCDFLTLFRTLGYFWTPGGISL